MIGDIAVILGCGTVLTSAFIWSVTCKDWLIIPAIIGLTVAFLAFITQGGIL